jgi:hypothetical protein
MYGFEESREVILISTVEVGGPFSRQLVNESKMMTRPFAPNDVSGTRAPPDAFKPTRICDSYSRNTVA